ncbi:hypothetical protein EJ04DRAFT_368325 [Polyplosphaeria fusca]|uniref:Uncharacterized protein n=1 Tax=Polyplosphaeria fusca TaxID=682080 RepID=A0A9P4QTU1_9PLEO|nr:hypothetical protein EJ04DRAFT_368325 [Polyplosphaeria fusca]
MFFLRKTSSSCRTLRRRRRSLSVVADTLLQSWLGPISGPLFLLSRRPLFVLLGATWVAREGPQPIVRLCV